MSAEPTPEQIAAWGKASRAASGVPPKIEDRAVLAKLVTLAFGGDVQANGAGPDRTTRRRGGKELATPPAGPAARPARGSRGGS